MGRFGDGYGSEWHLKCLIGARSERLESAILSVTAARKLRWHRAPFGRADSEGAREWRGIDFLLQSHPARSAYPGFWPTSGSAPNWDGLARLETARGEEWLLIEAKAHSGELVSDCKASPRGGRPQIERALAQVKAALGVAAERDWLTRYYQFCSRVAHLWFLNEQGVAARLLFVYFTGGRFPNGNIDCPETPEAWRRTLESQGRYVGLPAEHPLAHRVHKLFVDVQDTFSL